MTKYYWNILTKVADFAVERMEKIRNMRYTRTNNIRWLYYKAIIKRIIAEREKVLDEGGIDEKEIV